MHYIMVIPDMTNLFDHNKRMSDLCIMVSKSVCFLEIFVFRKTIPVLRAFPVCGFMRLLCIFDSVRRLDILMTEENTCFF